MKEFDIEKLERKNIYTVPENLFENIQESVLSGLDEFDLEKLERKNIYTVSENMYDDVQNHVISKIIPRKQAPVFKINWTYAVAASLALIFGATFVFNSDNESAEDNGVAKTEYAVNNNEPKTESEVVNQKGNKSFAQDKTTKQEKIAAQPVKSAAKKQEAQMNEYLDSFTSSEISELASNSTQDVYLDLYN